MWVEFWQLTLMMVIGATISGALGGAIFFGMAYLIKKLERKGLI